MKRIRNRMIRWMILLVAGAWAGAAPAAGPYQLEVVQPGHLGLHREILYLEVTHPIAIRVSDRSGKPAAGIPVTFTAFNGGRIMDFQARWCRDLAGTRDRSDIALTVCRKWRREYPEASRSSLSDSTARPQILGETGCEAKNPDAQCGQLTVKTDERGMARVEWIFGPRPEGDQYRFVYAPFPQKLEAKVSEGQTAKPLRIEGEAMDLMPGDFDLRAVRWSDWEPAPVYAGKVVPDLFVAYLYYRHPGRESAEGNNPPLERVDFQHGTKIKANFAVQFEVTQGGGRVTSSSPLAPEEGNQVKVWIANEEDARAEASWTLGCNTQPQTLEVVAFKEVWGAMSKSHNLWRWEVKPKVQPEKPFCIGKDDITLVDEKFQKLQYLPESTPSDPHAFYIKLKSPLNLLAAPPAVWKQSIPGVLFSQALIGTQSLQPEIMDRVEFNFIYDEQKGYHRAGPFEIVYDKEKQKPSVLGAIPLYSVRGASISAAER